MQDRPTACQFDFIYTVLHQRLSPRRIYHTLGAAHMSLLLAHRWGCDPDCALTAALLHDIAKEQKHDEILSQIEQDLQVVMHPDDRHFPDIWHALAGEIVARKDLGISSPEVGVAIRLHPTGDGEMALLEKIIFLADYIEPTRSFDGVDDLRRLAWEDLDKAVDLAIVRKTGYLRENGRKLHGRSQRALNKAQRRHGSDSLRKEHS